MTRPKSFSHPSRTRPAVTRRLSLGSLPTQRSNGNGHQSDAEQSEARQTPPTPPNSPASSPRGQVGIPAVQLENLSEEALKAAGARIRNKQLPTPNANEVAAPQQGEARRRLQDVVAILPPPPHRPVLIRRQGGLLEPVKNLPPSPTSAPSGWIKLKPNEGSLKPNPDGPFLQRRRGAADKVPPPALNNPTVASNDDDGDALPTIGQPNQPQPVANTDAVGQPSLQGQQQLRKPRRAAIAPLPILVGNHEAETGVMSLQDFGRLIKEKKLGIGKDKTNRNEAREALGNSLMKYHGEITQLQELLIAKNKDIVASGHKRNQLLNSPELKQYASIEDRIGGILFRISETSNQKITEEAKNTRLTQLNKDLEKAKQEKASLEPKIQEIQETIEAINQDIVRRFIEQRGFASTFLAQKAKPLVAEIINKAEAYKAHLKADSKQLTAIASLTTLKDPNILSDIKKTYEAVLGVPYQHQLAKAPRQLNTGTASEVFAVETNGTLGDSWHSTGFGKRAINANEKGNATTDNLQVRTDDSGILTESPNLVARQVMSYRVDALLDIGVTSLEVFSKDVDGRLLGISGRVNGTAAMRSEKTGDQYQKDIKFDHPTTQRMLSDLQLVDAITGQMDRHLGNIFIDAKEGTVASIDQDMAHPPNNDFASNPAKIGSNQLKEQFTRDAKGVLVYHQELIDAGTAEKILAINAAQLRATLEEQVGDERLPKEAVEAELERFEAVKNKVMALKQANKLVKEWNGDTYDALTKAGLLGKGVTNYYANYVAQGHHELELAKSGKKRNLFVEQ